MNESQETERLLAQLAKRAQNEVGLMAGVLARYRELENLSNDTLAVQFQTNALGLARLALCKQPASDAHFANQVREIAAYANADVSQIAQVIRHVQSVDALAQKPVAQAAAESAKRPISKWSGVVAAARDRDATEPKDEDDDVAGPDESKRD